MTRRSVARTTVLISILLITSMLGGCLGNSKPGVGQCGTVRVVAKIPDLFLKSRNVSVSSSDINVTTLEFTVSRGAVTHRKSVPVVDGLIEVEFMNLLVGTWHVKAVGKNASGLEVCTAEAPAPVKAGDPTVVLLKMELATGSLHVTVKFDPSLDITSGRVILVNPVEGDIVRDVTLGESSGSALFSDVAAMTWPIRVELLMADGSRIEGEEQVTVAPSDTTYALITVTDGSIIITILWQLPPSAPTGLIACQENSRALLSWDANPSSEDVVGYLVYRAASQSSPLSIISDYLVTGTSYEDEDGVAGLTYWYAVQAFDSNGPAGELSQRVPADAPQSVSFRTSNRFWRWGTTARWTLDFMAIPPKGRSIMEGSVTDPLGVTRPLEPDDNLPGNWRLLWYCDNPEPGVYTQSVRYDTGETETLLVRVPVEMVTYPCRPQLITPAGNAVVDTLTPMLEFTVPGESDTVMVKLVKSEATKADWFRANEPWCFYVPEGMLQSGQEYRWAVNNITEYSEHLMFFNVSDERRFTTR